ncbi:hypothetical protein CFP71_15490 [Amycolatopsis thailandensis]|uniref:SAM-dependent methyltransferase n=1 Tax=Amycolatopsis thailandensis TaxID=589330 RepID=A0A229SAQ7_9PSEU|nr:hypothetical protein [Amycolatopsis thailandensis]OXM55998.1 hypothetical protein CFP71_15490 [Amycolatopsis thailandensis]
MVELVLTDNRRSELVALLDDQERLQREYPKLAEYLDFAPGLPGTGDDQLDAAFDLRMIHYLTASESASSNPYWDIVAPLVSERADRRVVDGGRPSGSSRLAFAATILQSSFAYAIPSPETLEWVASACSGRAVVEVGAGRGYWAAQLSQSGLDVRAFDIAPPDATLNASFDHAVGRQAVWHSVRNVEELRPDLWDGGNSALFLCWPPGWGNSMASESLAKFEASGGHRLLFIGEPCGGKTGDESFFDALAARWSLIAEDDRFVSWWNLNDVAQVWERR